MRMRAFPSKPFFGLHHNVVGRWPCLVLVCLVALGFAGRSLAETTDPSPTYDELRQSAYRQLQAGESARKRGEAARKLGEATRDKRRFHEAQAFFREAVVADESALKGFRAAEAVAPKPSSAVFFQAVALNEMALSKAREQDLTNAPRSGAPHDYCAALAALDRAVALGLNPQLDVALLFERGRALLGVQRYAEASTMLKEFLAAVPADHPTRRDAGELKDVVEKKLHPETEDPCKKTEATTAAPASPPAHPLEQKHPIAFTNSITTGIGYDRNVNQLGRDQKPQPNVSGKTALFNETVINFEMEGLVRRWGPKEKQEEKIHAGGSIIHDAYADHDEANALSQIAFIRYHRDLDPKWSFELEVRNAWLRDDRRSVNNAITAEPGLTYAPTETLSTRLSYSATWTTFFQTEARRQKSDGLTHRVGIEQTWKAIRCGPDQVERLTLSGQFNYLATETEGISGDLRRANPLAKAVWTIHQSEDLCAWLRNATLSGSYEYRHTEYIYPTATVPALPGAPVPVVAPARFARRDDTHLFAVVLSITMFYDEAWKNRLELLLQYNMTLGDSNVVASAYDEPRFLASLKLNF